MKNELESPAQYGWLDTMQQFESTVIPWENRVGCYTFARRHGIKITIRKQRDGRAKVIRLEPTEEGSRSNNKPQGGLQQIGQPRKNKPRPTLAVAVPFDAKQTKKETNDSNI